MLKKKLFRIKFPRKNSVDAYVSPRSGARGPQRLPFLKYCYKLECERFTLWLNTAKNTIIKKCYEQKLFRIEFPTKKSVDAYLYLSQEWN